MKRLLRKNKKHDFILIQYKSVKSNLWVFLKLMKKIHSIFKKESTIKEWNDIKNHIYLRTYKNTYNSWKNKDSNTKNDIMKKTKKSNKR